MVGQSDAVWLKPVTPLSKFFFIQGKWNARAHGVLDTDVAFLSKPYTFAALAPESKWGGEYWIEKLDVISDS